MNTDYRELTSSQMDAIGERSHEHKERNREQQGDGDDVLRGTRVNFQHSLQLKE